MSAPLQLSQNATMADVPAGQKCVPVGAAEIHRARRWRDSPRESHPLPVLDSRRAGRAEGKAREGSSEMSAATASTSRLDGSLHRWRRPSRSGSLHRRRRVRGNSRRRPWLIHRAACSSIRAYLLGFHVAGLGVALGSMAHSCMIRHLTGGGWGTVIRRILGAAMLYGAAAGRCSSISP